MQDDAQTLAFQKRLSDEQIKAIASLEATIKAIKFPTELNAKVDMGGVGMVAIHGKQGPKGDSGEDGKQGIPGKTGPAGPPGKMGPPGQKGSDGPPGQDGAEGKPGKDGKDGNPGKNGEPGKDAEIDEKALEELVTKVEQLERKISQFNRAKKGGARGGGGGSVRYYDLTDQCDGAIKTFTIPANSRVLSVNGTQFPINYRPITDWTGSGTTTLTLTSAVSAPESGQTLYILYAE